MFCILYVSFVSKRTLKKLITELVLILSEIFQKLPKYLHSLLSSLSVLHLLHKQIFKTLKYITHNNLHINNCEMNN